MIEKGVTLSSIYYDVSIVRKEGVGEPLVSLDFYKEAEGEDESLCNIVLQEESARTLVFAVEEVLEAIRRIRQNDKARDN